MQQINKTITLFNQGRCRCLCVCLTLVQADSSVQNDFFGKFVWEIRSTYIIVETWILPFSTPWRDVWPKCKFHSTYTCLHVCLVSHFSLALILTLKLCEGTLYLPLRKNRSSSESVTVAVTAESYPLTKYTVLDCSDRSLSLSDAPADLKPMPHGICRWGL